MADMYAPFLKEFKKQYMKVNFKKGSEIPKDKMPDDSLIINNDGTTNFPIFLQFSNKNSIWYSKYPIKIIDGKIQNQQDITDKKPSGIIISNPAAELPTVTNPTYTLTNGTPVSDSNLQAATTIRKTQEDFSKKILSNPLPWMPNEWIELAEHLCTADGEPILKDGKPFIEFWYYNPREKRSEYILPEGGVIRDLVASSSMGQELEKLRKQYMTNQTSASQDATLTVASKVNEAKTLEEAKAVVKQGVQQSFIPKYSTHPEIKEEYEQLAKSAVANSAVANSAVAKSAVAKSAVANSAVAKSADTIVPSPSTSEDKYEKMKRMGVPMGAIISRITADISDETERRAMIERLFPNTQRGGEVHPVAAMLAKRAAQGTGNPVNPVAAMLANRAAQGTGNPVNPVAAMLANRAAQGTGNPVNPLAAMLAKGAPQGPANTSASRSPSTSRKAATKLNKAGMEQLKDLVKKIKDDPKYDTINLEKPHPLFICTNGTCSVDTKYIESLLETAATTSKNPKQISQNPVPDQLTLVDFEKIRDEKIIDRQSLIAFMKYIYSKNETQFNKDIKILFPDINNKEITTAIEEYKLRIKPEKSVFTITPTGSEENIKVKAAKALKNAVSKRMQPGNAVSPYEEWTESELTIVKQIDALNSKENIDSIPYLKDEIERLLKMLGAAKSEGRIRGFHVLPLLKAKNLLKEQEETKKKLLNKPIFKDKYDFMINKMPFITTAPNGRKVKVDPIRRTVINAKGGTRRKGSKTRKNIKDKR